MLLLLHMYDSDGESALLHSYQEIHIQQWLL